MLDLAQKAKDALRSLEDKGLDVSSFIDIDSVRYSDRSAGGGDLVFTGHGSDMNKIASIFSEAGIIDPISKRLGKLLERTPGCVPHALLTREFTPNRANGIFATVEEASLGTWIYSQKDSPFINGKALDEVLKESGIALDRKQYNNLYENLNAKLHSMGSAISLR